MTNSIESQEHQQECISLSIFQHRTSHKATKAVPAQYQNQKPFYLIQENQTIVGNKFSIFLDILTWLEFHVV